MTALQIGRTTAGQLFTLPVEIVTQAIAILGKRRAGKSTTARRMTEQLLHAGQQVVIADPKGDWWGLRSSRDGTQPGFPILIVGGEHGDLPLEATAGELLAQFVVEEGVSCVLDLGSLRKAQVASFMAEFLETLYRLKQKERYRTAMMLVIDEADAIAPQKPMPDQARMLGAAEDIVRRGGQRGIGCLMATQRASVLNKNVLNMIEVLMLLRTIAPLDLAAVEDWINVHGTPEQRKELLASLPALPIGTAWFWSPGWPDDRGIFQRVAVELPKTYDSSATPKPGERRTTPKYLADVDLSALQERMVAKIEKAKADDPKLLRQRIAELERDVARLRTATPSIDRVALERARAEGYQKGLSELAKYKAQIKRFFLQLEAHLKDGQLVIDELKTAVLDTPDDVAALADTMEVAPPARPSTNHLRLSPELADRASPHRAVSNGQADTKLGLAERKILSVLAQYPQGRTKTQLALLAGYSVKGGGFNNALGSLRSKGYIVGSQDLQITGVGMSALGTWEGGSIPLPTGPALVEYWLGQLSKAERAILQVLVSAGDQPMTKHEVAEAARYEVSGGGFNNALGRLRTLELIEGRSELRASAILLDKDD